MFGVPFSDRLYDEGEWAENKEETKETTADRNISENGTFLLYHTFRGQVQERAFSEKKQGEGQSFNSDVFLFAGLFPSLLMPASII